jgi:hypothetical protein
MKQTFLNILFLLNIGRPGLSQPQITTFFSTGNNWTDVVQLNPETYVATSGMQLSRKSGCRFAL